MNDNRWTYIGILLGLFLALLTTFPVFGVLYGVLFFSGNAILFGLGIIREPLLADFLYPAIILSGIWAIGCVWAGSWIGISFRQSNVFPSIKQKTSWVLAFSATALVLLVLGIGSTLNRHNERLVQEDMLRAQTHKRQQEYQKILQAEVDQVSSSDQYLIKLVTTGVHDGEYEISIRIGTYASEIVLVEQRVTVDMSQGENIFTLPVSRQSVIDGYHRKIMNETTMAYGLNEEQLRVVITLSPDDMKGAVPHLAETTLLLTFQKNTP